VGSRVAAAVALLLIAACQFPGADSGCNAQIDWVDFIQIGSTQYLARPGTSTAVNEGDLGSVYARVKFKVSGHVCDPSYRLKDGDAAFLDPGTPIYQVKGFPPTQRLAVRAQGRIVLYQAGSPSPPPG
jgi:hypothetical protein